MNPAEFSQRFFATEPGSSAAAELARDLVEDARYPARAVLERYLSSTEEAEQMKARNVLSDLREWALVPLATRPSGANLDTEVWAMRTMSAELQALRRGAASVLKDLLANRRPAPPAPEGAARSTYPPGTRVCDLAFDLLHRILHLESSAAGFFELPAADRDKRIQELESSRLFRAAFEDKL
jgi:hypothetical protein